MKIKTNVQISLRRLALETLLILETGERQLEALGYYPLTMKIKLNSGIQLGQSFSGDRQSIAMETKDFPVIKSLQSSVLGDQIVTFEFTMREWKANESLPKPRTVRLQRFIMDNLQIDNYGILIQRSNGPYFTSESFGSIQHKIKLPARFSKTD